MEIHSRGETERHDESPTLILPPDSHTESIQIQKCKLIAVSGPLQGQEFVVEKDFFTIGSGPHNDLVLRDSTISRHHCEIRLKPEGFLIRDLGSTNGTWVQGVRIAEAFLGQGTELQLGQTRLIFCPLQECMEYIISPSERFGRMIGKSVLMRRVFYLAETYAPTDATVLIEGETGTGKEILAEEIHRHSNRRDKPFVVIDCGALAKNLIESELFGHTKGAFTGATSDRIGAFEYANGGTVFLDEVGDLVPDLQPKLLRVLEKKEFKRLGSNEVRNVDVRIICATNRKLENEVNAGRFREDLYFRLSLIHIELPPLRKRKEDIAPLVRNFLEELHGPNAMSQVQDFDRTIRLLCNHDWPGNVRELRNLVAVAFYSGVRPINLASFLYFARIKFKEGSLVREYTADRPFKVAKGELIEEFEKEYIRDLLEKNAGNISRAARQAGIERAYLQRLIKKYGLKGT
ncbi:MAG: sigma 54-interacting transcriptional regulator [Kiritimatiellia bacterium]